mmetsp:Transcript_15928/g.20119  ORF Transcript_15928/g.20119 Transcript_15928/m.20119 type:complete len:81 (-) Transcript_15928:199-441(-)
MAAFASMPNTAVYAGTKTHNRVLGLLASRAAQKSEIQKDLIDFQTLHPAGVSTNLNGFKQVGGDCVTPESCARGSLADLG